MSMFVQQDKDISRYYHGEIRREFVGDLLKENGDFLIRKSSTGPTCVSVKWGGTILHYQPACTENKYSFGSLEFRTFDECVLYYWKNGIPLSEEPRTLLKNPIKRGKKFYKKEEVEIVCKLGGGNFGDVYKIRVKSEGNREYAMKTLRATVNKETKDNFRLEMDMMSAMRHDNVVQCYGTVEDDAEVRIVLELINHGSLDKLLRKCKVTEKGKARICCQVAGGVAYLHAHGVIHRDLAARNILVHQNPDGTIVAKVSDFGLSRRDESGRGYELRTAQKLPLKWLAPECFQKRIWTSASDVWSFGVLMWEVYTNGDDPYGDKGLTSQAELSKFIAQGGHPNYLKDVLAEINKIMMTCWTMDVKRRPTMENVWADLERIYPAVKNNTVSTTTTATTTLSRDQQTTQTQARSIVP